MASILTIEIQCSIKQLLEKLLCVVTAFESESRQERGSSFLLSLLIRYIFDLILPLLDLLQEKRQYNNFRNDNFAHSVTKLQ